MYVLGKVQTLKTRTPLEKYMSNPLSNTNSNVINFYNEDWLKNKYELRKQSCIQRFISFEFTLQQWLDFHKLLYSGDIKCAYTNLPFLFLIDHPQTPTIERISDTDGYNIRNVLWVSKVGNEVKNQLVHNGGDFTKTSNSKYAVRIKRIMDSAEALETIRKPYMKLINNQENTVEIKEVVNEAPTKTHNTEIDVAHRYVEFGKFIEQVADSQFEITYAQFKYMVGRKWCMLTKRELPSSIYDMGFFILDKTAPITKSNVFVTTKKIQEAMDRLQADLKLTKEEIINIAKVLAK